MSSRVAAVQFKRPQTGDAHIALADWADRAARSAKVVVLPEMAATGYLFRTPEAVRRVAEDARGPTFQVLSPIAKMHQSWIVAGYPEVDGDRLFNSACVINPRGELAFTYRKTLLYEADEFWASVGDSGYHSFDTEVGKVGLGICMDLNDDRFLAWMHAQTLDVLAFPTNWVFEEDGDVWSYWAWRLGFQRTTLVAANTYGWEQHVRFTGRSLILKERTVLAHAPQEGNAVIASAP